MKSFKFSKFTKYLLHVSTLFPLSTAGNSDYSQSAASSEMPPRGQPQEWLLPMKPLLNTAAHWHHGHQVAVMCCGHVAQAMKFPEPPKGWTWVRHIGRCVNLVPWFCVWMDGNPSRLGADPSYTKLYYLMQGVPKDHRKGYWEGCRGIIPTSWSSPWTTSRGEFPFCLAMISLLSILIQTTLMTRKKALDDLCWSSFNTVVRAHSKLYWME